MLVQAEEFNARCYGLLGISEVQAGQMVTAHLAWKEAQASTRTQRAAAHAQLKAATASMAYALAQLQPPPGPTGECHRFANANSRDHMRVRHYHVNNQCNELNHRAERSHGC
jgi:hypothetical protein